MINVCVHFCFVPDLTYYLYTNNMPGLLKAIYRKKKESYITQCYFFRENTKDSLRFVLLKRLSLVYSYPFVFCFIEKMEFGLQPPRRFTGVSNVVHSVYIRWVVEGLLVPLHLP